MKLEALRKSLMDVVQFGVFDKNRLGALAHDLEETQRELTRRLMKSEESLAQNKLNEALRIAEGPPRLFSAVARYQQLPHKAWKSIAQSHGLPPSLELARKSVERLKELYARADILPHLREYFRTLATGAEASADALAVLHQICAMDPKSPEAAILADWERSRFAHIDHAIKTGAIASDEIGVVLEELRAPGWTVAPPAALIQSVSILEQQQRGSRAEELYQYQLAQLQDALDSQDLSSAQSALKYIDAIKAYTGVDLPAAQREQVAAAAETVETQRSRQNNAVVALESMLDEQASVRAIESRLEQAARAGVKIPGALEQRIRAHVLRAEQARERSRRTRSIVVSFFVILCVGAGAFLFWRNASRSGENSHSASVPDPSGPSPLPAARAALPDLERYAELLKEGERKGYKDPEFAKLAEWNPRLQSYKAVLQFGARIKSSESSLSKATTFANFQKTLGNDLQEMMIPTPYSTLRAHYAQRRRIQENPSVLQDVQAVLASSALTGLQVFNELDGEGRVIATIYTGNGCAFEDAGQGNVVIPVMLNDANHSEPKKYPKNRVTALQTPAHTALGAEIQAFLKKEAEAPEWVPAFAPLFHKAVYSVEMEPFVRWLLLNQLFTLDSEYFGILKAADATRKRLRELNPGAIEFWLSGSQSVRDAREKLRAGMKDLQPALLDLAHDADEAERAWKLALPALLRPVQFAGVIERGADGKPRPWLLKDTDSARELWTLQGSGAEYFFVIAAVKTGESNWRWIEEVKAVAGQPLLAPADALNSLDFWRKTSGNVPVQPVSPFPLNVLAAESPSK